MVRFCCGESKPALASGTQAATARGGYGIFRTDSGRADAVIHALRVKFFFWDNSPRFADALWLAVREERLQRAFRAAWVLRTAEILRGLHELRVVVLPVIEALGDGLLGE